jgi:predicted secreted Zn-dependent protease
MKNKDINWLNDKIQDIKKRKRNLRMLQDPELKKKIKKDLKREYRSVKRSEKQNVEKHIKEEILNYND